ncbi:MAG: hypothetical protein EXS16_09780 [Gemmataceae bacterium]|nr:hypothetical protein [Gemmataceae bacterium]
MLCAYWSDGDRRNAANAGMGLALLRIVQRLFAALALGCAWSILASSPSVAQQTDLSDLIKRLDRLEQKNLQLEAQNDQLKKQIDDLKTPAPITLPAAAPSVQPVAGYPSIFTTVQPGAASMPTEKRNDPERSAAESPPFQVGQPLKMEATWHNAMWFESPDKAVRWTVGGVVQYDTTYFKAPSAAYININSIGTFNNRVDTGYSLQDSNSFRRARLRFAGNLWEQVEFAAQYEFAQALDLRRRTLGISPTPTSTPFNDYDPGEDVGFNEVYIGLNQLPLLGTIRIGRHRESLNFVTATPNTNQIWLERGLLFDAFNGDFNFSNGITVQNTYWNDRIYTCLGFFHANNNSNRGFFSVGGGEYAYDGRLTALPVYDEDRQLWVHVGADYSYRIPHQDRLRYRARPMIRSGTSFQTPNILNTGAIFTNDAQQIANLE